MATSGRVGVHYWQLNQYKIERSATIISYYIYWSCRHWYFDPFDQLLPLSCYRQTAIAFVWLISNLPPLSLMQRFAFLIGSFPDTVDAAVTTLLSFYWTKVTFNFLSFTTSQVPLCFFHFFDRYQWWVLSSVWSYCASSCYTFGFQQSQKTGTCAEVVHNKW